MSDIFTSNILHTVVQLQPSEFNDSIDQTILDKLRNKVEGKCDRNGYIKPGSTEIVKRSLGQVLQGNFNGSCNFRISFKVDICNPVEGMVVKVIVKNINKMGLFCELHNIEPSPLSIILAKQHHLKSDKFENIKMNSIIQVEIIGVKFDYNDTQIKCIGRLTEDGKTIEEEHEDDEVDETEEMDLGDSTSSEEDEEEDESLSNNNLAGGGKNDIISMVGGTLNKTGELEEEIVLDENLELNLEEVEMEDNQNEINIDEDLGLDFEGEVMDLDAVSRKETEPLFLHENYEIPNKLTEDVFQREVRSNSHYAPFIKKPTNKINYHIYLILSDLFINFYEKYGMRPKKICLSTRNKYYKSIKNFMKINASSYELEENDNRTFVL
jgi:DNA-directed RNA polymerase subunit E'/Rpb7